MSLLLHGQDTLRLRVNRQCFWFKTAQKKGPRLSLIRWTSGDGDRTQDPWVQSDVFSGCWNATLGIYVSPIKKTYQPEPNVRLAFQQYIQLPAVYSQLAVYSVVYSMTSQIRIHSWSFNSIFNYWPESNVQLVIQQYIQLPVVYSQLAVYSITSHIQIHSWLEPNVQLVIQQYIQLPAVYSQPAVYSAVYAIIS